MTLLFFGSTEDGEPIVSINLFLLSLFPCDKLSENSKTFLNDNGYRS
jgi:hypothetical protein